MLRTTPKVDDAPEFNRRMAANPKTVAMTPESTFARSGVPRRAWNAPKKGKKLPSAEATARTRSPHIIQADPEFINEDEEDTGDAVHEARGSTIDRVAGLDRIEKPSQAGDLAGRQDEEHQEDRHEVAEGGERARTENRLGHIALRIEHLLRRPVLPLKADKREEDQRRDGQEPGARRGQAAAVDSLEAVIEPVDQDGHGEERHQRHLEDRAQRRNPLCRLGRR
jgi:hypothetical protein